MVTFWASCATEAIKVPFQAPATTIWTTQRLSKRDIQPSQRRLTSRYLVRAGPLKGPTRDNDAPRASLLPAGKRQARVELPALFINVSAGDIASTLGDVAAAVAGGATAVVITETADGGAAQLYETALAVKEMLRGRAALLLSDRTDIANAIDAEGVLLSSSGLPTVVAKNMLQNTGSLVGRAAADASQAVQAAAEGASFIVLQPDVAAVQAAQQQQISGSSVPLIIDFPATTSSNNLDRTRLLPQLLAAGANGIAVPLAELIPTGSATSAAGASPPGDGFSYSDAAKAIISTLKSYANTPSSRERLSASVLDSGTSSDSEFEFGTVAGSAAAAPPVAQLSQLLSASREDAIAAEKEVIARLIEFLETSCPALEEVSLLRDAVDQLDELFLLVIVGEFNSGKSAVVNALLGCRVLSEGILPTTNEISVLKWADPEDPRGERSEQTADGLFTRHIKADLLREVNLVDTPGTNVILGRQQRLTEEFVPRSDLVLFVMSADRPFTDSEVQFLKYIRQWGKKVVFVVNKCDLLASEEEIAEVVGFVSDNAARVLGVEGAKVVPVSARLATEAKLSSKTAGHEDSPDALTLTEQKQLAKDQRWHASRFEGLEGYVRDFLLGTGVESSGESVRLKLKTPLSVAEALLEAAVSALEAEAEVARADASSIGLVRSQLDNFKNSMGKEGQLQRDEVSKKLSGIANRAAAVIDATLTLSNWDSLSRYILGSKNSSVLPPVASLFRQEVPKDSAAALAAVVKEHSVWIHSNCQRQVDNYRGFAAERLASLGKSFDELEDVEAAELRRDPEARKRWRQVRAAVVVEGNDDNASMANTRDEGSSSTSTALAAASAFDPGATEALLETDVREAVLSTASTAAGAGAFGILLTTVLPTTVEDLLALGLSAAIAYASVLNLPLRRAETKKKAELATEAAATEVKIRMERELQSALQQCEGEVMSFIEPLEELAAEAADKADAAVAKVKALAAEVAELQIKVANVE
ncbi:hypothetical protein Ndes2437B_g05823 [Nannochloris sp. 'desiccata']|nr:hypothetical protein KSW81_007793 [Chlorella desiccata (nom. nud.)]